MPTLTHILLALPPADPGGPAPTDGGDGGGFNFLPFLIVIVLLMLVMPLFNKKEKSRQKRVGALKKHDRVVTSGGIYGTVAALDEHTVTLEVAKDVRMRIKRTSVYDIEKPGDGTEDAAARRKAGAKS